MNPKEEIIQIRGRDPNPLQFYMNPDAVRFVPRVANEKYHLQV